ncbi:MAG: hypothetical protein D6681_04785 [Calditrichaeota bacterium]|nr:MAG: hypothetical protein D6681_04785 [Calditrichota bacterium]
MMILGKIALAGDPPKAQPPRPPIEVINRAEPDRYYYDGRLPHAVGVHLYQVLRANRAHPPEGGQQGWTYSHQPYLAYWNGKFYVQYLSGLYWEHEPPTRTMLTWSEDGRHWSKPVVAFPEYPLPEIHYAGYTIPEGTISVMHQRMGFYVAPNGRLLTLAFYSFCPTPRFSPNKGQGIGRVVREVYRDGTLGPIYFIRYNRHNGWNETNTRYLFYKSSPDTGFVEACEALLNDKLMILQWWEEDRGKDGFYPIDPSRVVGPVDLSATQLGVTTSKGSGKAFCFYTRPDGKVVGIWKNAYFSLSPDRGYTWSPIVKINDKIRSPGAKIWGQRLDDGSYALVYDHSATGRNRYPMVIRPGKDGYHYEAMFVINGEVPPMRYQGLHKNPGPQYVRGIVEGNGNPPGDHLWITYSVNKEDIWVGRIRVPVSGEVSEPVAQNFEGLSSIAGLEWWNLYLPQWAPAGIRQEANGNHYLLLKDEDPYDYCKVERIFPEDEAVTVHFRFRADQLPQGRAVFVEIQSATGERPIALRIDKDWLSLDHLKVKVSPLPIQTNQWYDVSLKIDCKAQAYDLALNGQWERKGVAFGEKAAKVQRLVFRTGPYRGEVPKWLAEMGEPKTAGLYREDLPCGGEKVEPIKVGIDDVEVR